MAVVIVSSSQTVVAIFDFVFSQFLLRSCFLSSDLIFYRHSNYHCFLLLDSISESSAAEGETTITEEVTGDVGGRDEATKALEKRNKGAIDIYLHLFLNKFN